MSRARAFFHHLDHAIQKVEYEFMLVGARVTDGATVEIIRDNGRLLTISISGGLLPVHLIVDPPGAARLVRLLAEYAKKGEVTLSLDPRPYREGTS